MDIRLNGILSGTVTPPPSKSQAHRLLICAALGTKPCSILCNALNDDLTATANSLNALGADIKYSDGRFTVLPIRQINKKATLNCAESGSTLRFLLSIAAVLGADATFEGCGKLPQRPNGALRDTLSEHGVAFKRHSDEAELPLSCCGTLKGGMFRLPGNLSSQYLTGLLFALPLAKEDSVVEIVGDLTSASYVSMTLDALHRSGISIHRDGNRFHIPGNQEYSLPDALAVEGDWSSAAFWIVAGVVGANPITVTGMNSASLQGDRGVIALLRKMGAFIDEKDNCLVAMPSQLFGAELDCMNTPDLLPILSVAAAVAKGDTVFTNVGRLRFKESDRLLAMQTTLSSFGISSQIGDDTFTVYGGNVVSSTGVDSFGDHRIAMSAAILSTLSSGVSTIKGAECVAKSYPGFYKDFISLGGTSYQ